MAIIFDIRCILSYVIQPVIAISLLVVFVLLVLIRWLRCNNSNNRKCLGYHLNDAASILMEKYVPKKDRYSCTAKIITLCGNINDIDYIVSVNVLGYYW